MKRHEFEYECLQMILDKKSQDFVDGMTEGDLRENMIEFFNVWATHRHNPEALSSHLSRFIAGMIAYESKHSKYGKQYLIYRRAGFTVLNSLKRAWKVWK